MVDPRGGNIGIGFGLGETDSDFFSQELLEKMRSALL